MDPKNDTEHDDFTLSLPLPTEGGAPGVTQPPNQAAEIIRQKVQAAYGSEPPAATEALDTMEQGPSLSRSAHQKFILGLTMSGKSLPEIQTAWHEYYSALSDTQKHQVWEEFYSAHAQASRYSAARPAMAPKSEQVDAAPRKPAAKGLSHKKSKARETITDMRDRVRSKTGNRAKLKPKQHLSSLLFGLAIGAVAVLILMFGFFNERFIAPFIQPSRTVTNTPIISQQGAVGEKPVILIPKINVEIPVVYGMTSVDPAEVNKALEQGVLHYAGTPLPGQNGNLVIVGHSSNNIFNKGNYKFAFALLNRLEVGDTFYLEKDGQRYTYQVYEKKIVKPTDISVLQTQSKPATATLITCDPPGTSINRLAVMGEQIDPDPAANTNPANTGSSASQTEMIPGNSPSLWSRFVDWLPF